MGTRLSFGNRCHGTTGTRTPEVLAHAAWQFIQVQAASRFGLIQASGVAQVIPRYYRQTMKVAISLPDPIFSAAEKLAHRLRVSRSQLYAQAIEEYLGKRQDSLVTERLNAVYAAGQEPVDPALAAAQLGAIGHEAW